MVGVLSLKSNIPYYFVLGVAEAWGASPIATYRACLTPACLFNSSIFYCGETFGYTYDRGLLLEHLQKVLYPTGARNKLSV
jgi:hypothetical protein